MTNFYLRGIEGYVRDQPCQEIIDQDYWTADQAEALTFGTIEGAEIRGKMLRRAGFAVDVEAD